MTAKKTKKEEEKTKKEEDLEGFVIENEEKILKMLKDGKIGPKAKMEREAEKGKAFMKGVIQALTDKEVQGHFMRMGLEMIMGIGALIKALPLPEEMAPLVENVTEQTDALGEIVNRKEPGAPKKKKKPIEKIEVK